MKKINKILIVLALFLAAVFIEGYHWVIKKLRRWTLYPGG